ncbi:MAG: hypothetical protein RLZZ479_1326 [Bacteroidota bacterium]|jgi:hypothetical protein
MKFKKFADEKPMVYCTCIVIMQTDNAKPIDIDIPLPFKSCIAYFNEYGEWKDNFTAKVLEHKVVAWEYLSETYS